MQGVSESTLGVIAENKNKYEEVSIKADPFYEYCLRAIDIIKKFISERNLIIYGGTAIDYALRLRGDKIYPDEELAIPDLDFYSSDSVKDAYDLADILFKEGFTEVRAIRASHVTTMRVDVGHQFLADITYMPPTLFDKVPHLEYENMKIVHPNFQRMDLHIGLTYLYDSPPREAIFQRWKFIKRLNLLDKYYPLPDTVISKKKTMCVLERKYSKYVFAGCAAYAMMIIWTRNIEKELMGILSEETKKFCENEWKNVEILNLHTEEFSEGKGGEKSGRIIIESYDGAEFVHFDIADMAKDVGLVEQEKYIDVGSFIPERIYGIDKSFKDQPCGVTIYSSEGKFVAVGSIEKNKLSDTHAASGSSKTRFVGSQYLLSNFISKWIITGDNTNIVLYKSLISLIKIMEKMIMDKFPFEDRVAMGDAKEEDIRRYITENPLFITTKSYGNENMSETVKITLYQIATDLQIPGVNMPAFPVNYYPARKKARKVPDFVYDSSEFFIKDGRRIDK